MALHRTTAWEGIAFAPIEAAKLKEDSAGAGAPVSTQYDDVYFNADDGLGETQYVFLQQNELERRFLDCERFSIGELGFGTGLSFLTTVELWARVAPAEAHLHFLSFERHPIPTGQLEQIHQHWPQFACFAEELRANLPEHCPGLHRVSFRNPKITLTLAYGDARELMPLLHGSIDAWFLDGFSPSKNPELWDEQIAREIGRCSSPGTTFSTFSAAGHVRRSLAAAGFRVEKEKGFAHKRELLRGVFERELSSDTLPFAKPKGRRVTIVGAGMAGVLSARSLVRRGYEVTIVDKAHDICQGASGNPSATLMPPVYSQYHALHRFYLAGFQYTRNHLVSLARQGNEVVIRGRGVIKVPNTRQEKKLISCLPEMGIPESLVRWMSVAEAKDILGFAPREDVLFFPTALCYQPYAYCEEILKELCDSVRLLLDTEVSSLERSADLWQLRDSAKRLIAESECVILANAFSGDAIKQTAWMQIEKIRGQIAVIPTTALATDLQVGFFDKVYLLPDTKDAYVLGATWDHNDPRTEPDQDQQQDLVRDLERAMGQRCEGALTNLDGRVSFRSSTPDRMPYVGPLWRGTSEEHQGLYVNLGHGSRGGAACGLSAEILAAYIEGEVFPCDTDVLRTLNPLREAAFKAT